MDEVETRVSLRAGQSRGDALAVPLLPPGTMVDHYRVMRLLGRGGMGEIYLARDTRLGRRVALKVIAPELIGARDNIDRFMLEARITARFDHPHIVTIHGVGEHAGRPYLALAFVEGQNLRDRMAERRASVPEALRFGHAIALALREAHAHEVLHRDLKPANVLIGRDGRARVLDFGLAHALGPDRTDGAPPSSPAPSTPEQEPSPGAPTDGEPTSSATDGGTPAYMAPEQWREQACTPATDVWALGVVLFELCAGRRPFNEETLIDQAAVVTSPDRAPALQGLADVPAKLSELVAACLQKDPSARPSADAVAASLEQLLGARRASRAEIESPFRGLLPFTERQVELFFGREQEIAATSERLRMQPVLALVGPSGAGKSSFVKAGLVPRLREQAAWLVLEIRPGSDPLHAVAARLLRQSSDTRSGLNSRTEAELTSSSATTRGGTDAQTEQSLAARLGEQPHALAAELRALAEQRNARVLLFVDQLEELFTLCQSDTTRRAFMRAICLAADDASDPVRVLFTVRDDFLGRLATGPEARDALSQVMVVQRLDSAALHQVLTRPLDRMGYRFEDAALVDEMVREVEGEASGLPLLQFSAQMLWEQRDRERRLLLRSAYERLGGVAGALAKHADGVLGGFTTADQRLARKLLLRLVTPERTRRVVPRRALREALGDAVAPLLTRLVKERLVSVTRSGGHAGGHHAVLELAHESLITNWHTLAHWIDASRDELSFVGEVSQAAALWHKRGRRPEELWRGDALREAERMRGSVELSDLATAFLDTARRRSERARQRKRVAVATALVTLMAVAAVLALQKHQLAAEKQRAEQQRNHAEQSRARALREGARAALAAGQVLQARAKLRVALEIETATEADDAAQLGRSAELRALWWRLRDDPRVWTKRFAAHAYGVSYAPAGNEVAAAMQDGSIYLVNTTTAASRALRGHRDQIFVVSYSPNGRWLASGAVDGEVILWDLPTGKPHRLQERGESIYGIAFSPDSKRLATGSVDESVSLWSVASGQILHRLRGHAHGSYGVAFSANGRWLASTGRDDVVRLWHADSGKLERELRGHQHHGLAVAFSPDSKLLASAGGGGELRLWEVATGKPLRSLAGHEGDVWGVAFSPDGKRLASASRDRTVRLWSIPAGQPERVLHGHTAMVVGVAFSPDGKRLVTGSYDQTVRLWDLTVGGHRQQARGHEAPVYGLSFSPDGKRIVSGGVDKTLRLWRTATGEQLATMRGHDGAIWSVRFSPDGKLIASGAEDRTVRLWDAQGGMEQRVLNGHTGRVTTLDFSPNGELLASTGADHVIRLWNVDEGTLGGTLRGQQAMVYRLAFSPDGGTLASGSSDKTVWLWDLATAQPRRRLEGHSGPVWGVSFSPDGQRLLSASADKTLRLWDPRTGQLDKIIGPVGGRLYACVFLPDGARAAAPCSDGKAHIFGLRSGSDVIFNGHAGEVNTVAISPDGALAASGGDDHTVRLWRTDNGAAVWRAPVLLSGTARGKPTARPLMLSHLGWSELDAAGRPRPATKPAAGPHWREAMEQRAARAVTVGDGRAVCVRTASGLEIWNLASDELRLERKLPGIDRITGASGGCAVHVRGADGKPDRVLLVRAGQGDIALPSAGTPTALAARPGGVLVAAGRAIYSFDAKGVATRRPRPVGAGITAVALAAADGDGDGALYAVGFGDGNIELWPASPGEARLDRIFEQTPSSAVEHIVRAPMHTLAVGFADGTLALYDQNDGQQLDREHLHGPVQHLLIDGEALYAVSALGSTTGWDLGVFVRDDCALMRELWQRVRVVWDAGGLGLRPPPSGHRCAGNAKAAKPR